MKVIFWNFEANFDFVRHLQVKLGKRRECKGSKNRALKQKEPTSTRKAHEMFTAHINNWQNKAADMNSSTVCAVFLRLYSVRRKTKFLSTKLGVKNSSPFKDKMLCRILNKWRLTWIFLRGMRLHRLQVAGWPLLWLAAHRIHCDSHVLNNCSDIEWEMRLGFCQFCR